MENPVISYDAANWIGRLSVHQDLFWFASLLAWCMAMILWLRHPQRRAAWAWLPGPGLAAIATTLLQFGLFNPTFDIFQDRLIPGTVANYRTALIDPHWLADVLTGTCLAVMCGWWGWTAASRSGRAHLRWWPVAAAAGAVALHAADPVSGGLLLSTFAATAGLALWPVVRGQPAARRALVLAVLLPLLSTVGPLAAALHLLQRNGPPSPIGLGAATFQSLLGLLVVLSLVRGLPARLPVETQDAFRQDRRRFALLAGLLLAAGLIWAVQTGHDNRREIQQNRLRAAAAQAMVFDPALLAPFHRPEFRIDSRSPGGEPAPAHSEWLARAAADAARRRLDEVVIATPFLDTARLVVLHDGWLVAVLSSDRRIRPGEIEVLRRATPEDRARWERHLPYVEESPVPEIGYAYYCRAPIVSHDGRMLAWLDCVRREYYLSVERRWRAAPLLVTTLGLVLLTSVYVQRQITREREIALRDAAIASEGSRIKTAFLANVSHELRTPLQSILGYSELLADDITNPESQGHLTALRQQGELMTRLVNDLIDLSAVDAGSFQLAKRPLAPADLIRSTVEGLRPRAEAKGLALRLAIDDGVPAWVSADGDRWRQVLTNLLANAIKFTDRGSVSVWFRGEPEPDGRLRFTLAVCDTGPGIPPAQRSRLFTAFSRLEQTAEKEGSGLGLAVSAAICRAMDGSLGVESDGCTGSTFTAVFRAAPAAARAQDPAPAAARRATALRVLIVDDNPLVRELFLSALTEGGAICRAAGSASVALALLGVEKADVIVLDLALPDGDGADFVPRFRRLAPGVRIVGASAHARHQERERALAAGMDTFLVKPVALDTLWAEVTAAGGTRASGTSAFFELPPALRDRLRAEFARDLPERRATLAAAVQAGDWAGVRSSAHYLRNSALVVQAPALFEACSGLEAAAAAADPAAAAQWWPRCAAACDALAAA